MWGRYRYQLLHRLWVEMSKRPSEMKVRFRSKNSDERFSKKLPNDATQVMPNDGHTDDAQSLNELFQLVANHFGFVIGPPSRFVRIVESLQIDSDDTIVLCQFGDLVTPADPTVGETVQQENHVGVLAASLDVVNF
jgi:hypothetical protein